MVVCEKVFEKFRQNFLSKGRLKNFLIDNHYKTIYGQSEGSALPAGCIGIMQKLIAKHIENIQSFSYTYPTLRQSLGQILGSESFTRWFGHQSNFLTSPLCRNA